MYTSCWKKIANEREKDGERRREMKRATINMSQMAETMQERSKSKMMMTRTGKKVTKCWHRFFISFHSLPCPAMSFHSIPFHSVPLCSHLCQFIWWHGHVCSAFSISLYLSFCGIIIKMPWPGGRLCKIFWCLKVRKTKQKKKMEIWTDI